MILPNQTKVPAGQTKVPAGHTKSPLPGQPKSLPGNHKSPAGATKVPAGQPKVPYRGNQSPCRAYHQVPCRGKKVPCRGNRYLPKSLPGKSKNKKVPCRGNHYYQSSCCAIATLLSLARDAHRKRKKLHFSKASFRYLLMQFPCYYCLLLLCHNTNLHGSTFLSTAAGWRQHLCWQHISTSIYCKECGGSVICEHTCMRLFYHIRLPGAQSIE